MQDNTEAKCSNVQNSIVDQTQTASINNQLDQPTPVSNALYIQKLIESLGYSVSDLEYAEQPPPYSKLSVPVLTWKSLYAKQQSISLVDTESSKVFLVLCIIYFLRSLLEAALGFTLAIMSNYLLLYSFWSGSFLLIGGIVLYIAHFRSSEIIYYSRHIYIMFSLLHLIFPAIVYFTANIYNTPSSTCLLFSKYLCYHELTDLLQMALVSLISLAICHDFLNIQVAYIVHFKAKLSASIATI